VTLAPAIGVQTPRIETIPRYTTSSGADAIELAEMAGLILDPWQRYVLRHAMGERIVPHPITGQLGPRWSAFEVGLIVSRQSGKGSIIEARQLAGLFLLKEPLQIYSAHEFKTSGEMFLRIKRLIDDNDEFSNQVAKMSTSHGEEGITLKNGSRLRFVARSTGSGRGFSGDTVYLDEAFNLSSASMAALLPILSARPNPQLFYMSSAGWEISRFLGTVRRRGIRMSADPDPDSRLMFMEWSADDAPWWDFSDEQKLAYAKDRRNWARANPGLGYRISEDVILAELDALGEDLDMFARERLGIGRWPVDEKGWNVISEDAWLAQLDPDAAPMGKLVMAVDVTPDRSRACIAVAGDMPDRPGERVVEVAEHRSGTYWVPQRVADMVSKHKPALVVVSPRGPAGGLLPDIQKALEKIRRKNVLRETGSQEENQACQAFYDGVTSAKTIVHRGDLRLSGALAGAQKKLNPEAGTWHWSRRSPSTDLSPLWASTLALWGHSVAPTRHSSWASFD
jgi:hypothetical protein